MGKMTRVEKRPWFRRRRVLLQPRYQLRVAATILTFIVAYSLLLGFLIFLPLYQEFTAATNPEGRFSLAHQILALHRRFWPSVLVVGVIVACQSFFVTQRVVGPAFRLQRVLAEFAAGKYENRMQLRRGDRLKELETAVNVLGESLCQRAAIQRAREIRLHGAVAALREAATGFPLPPALQEALGEIDRIATESSGSE